MSDHWPVGRDLNRRTRKAPLRGVLASRVRDVLRIGMFLIATTVVSTLCLRLVPKRWDSVDVKVRPWGLTVSAESDSHDPE